MESPSVTRQNLCGGEECVMGPGVTLRCGKMFNRLGSGSPLVVIWFTDEEVIEWSRIYRMSTRRQDKGPSNLRWNLDHWCRKAIR